MTIKPKRWKKGRISGMNIQRGTRRATMGSSIRDCVDTRNNSWITTLTQRWIIPLPMLLPMGGWILKMMSIRSIGWRTRTVYLHLCLTIKYRISWVCTCKVRNGIIVSELVSWKNHGLNKIWRRFSLFFAPINYIVVVTSRRRWWTNSPSDSTTWRRCSSTMESMSSTPRIASLDRYSLVAKSNSSNQLHQE